MLFPAEGIEFLRDLKSNNDRVWFQDNKKSYDTYVKEPAKQFAAAVCSGLEERLKTNINHKIFRINRDLRFSKDKTPYNTHMRFSFWMNGTAKPMLTPAFHVSLEPDLCIVGGGCLQFPAEMLCVFRANLKSPSSAEKLNSILSSLTEKGAELSEPELKRPPQGIAADHPEAEHMRRKGVACWYRQEITAPAPVTASHILEKTSTLEPFITWLQSLEQ